MYVLLAIVGLVATVSAKDLTIGREGGRLKYEQNFTASPTIWQQAKTVTFNVSESEVITQVVIVDQREDKNGEAAIIEGGENQKNVTIELKSPAVFRGFDFEIRVYAKQENDIQSPVDRDQQTVQNPLLRDTQVNDNQVPEKVSDDVITGSSVTSTTQMPNGQDKVQHPVVIGQEDNQQVRPNRDIQGQEPEQKTVKPTPSKDLQSAINENQSEVAQEGQSKGVNPMTIDNDWQATNKPSVLSKKPTGEPMKPVAVPAQHFDDSQMLDINGDNVSVVGVDGNKKVQSSTEKNVESQQTEKSIKVQETDDSQQAKKQVNVPLPYIKH
ncbi:unnamed protein product [Arctia plantaginis]|uniref:Uncharacterized protein n=1 Tax=Arctia plantaginis TaxID=874455 RepID=A0A8S0Z117_ARCPL|nr:unnamed protein product [Arctia plantaginis]